MKILKSSILFSLLVLFIINGCSIDKDIETSLYNNDLEIEMRQYILNGFVNLLTPCEAADLTYYVEDCLDGTGYVEGIQAAMSAYNDAPLGLFWTEVSDSSEADLVFACGNGNCGTGVASPPVNVEEVYPDIFDEGDVEPNLQTTFDSGGSIGGLIILNTPPWSYCKCSDDEMDLCFFSSTVMHEIGHALGMLHNELNIFAFSLYEHIDGTPVGSDPTSIFNGGNYYIIDDGDFCDRPCQFNANDMAALQLLYPEPVIDGPEEICIGLNGEFCFNINDDSTINFWTINGTPIISTSGIECFTFPTHETGNYTIGVSVTNGDCTYTVSKLITVLEFKDCAVELPHVHQGPK